MAAPMARPAFLGETQTTLADSSAANDTWLARQLTGIVPAGATEARLVLQFLQPTGQAGAVHVDDVSFGIVDAVPLAGDYNHDGVVDPDDYDVWKNNFGSTANLDADGNNNGVVDAADYTVWQRQCRRDARGRRGRSSGQRSGTGRLGGGRRRGFRRDGFSGPPRSGNQQYRARPTETSPTTHRTDSGNSIKSIKVSMKYIRINISALHFRDADFCLRLDRVSRGDTTTVYSNGQGHRSPPHQNGGACVDRHAAAFRKGRRHFR